MFFKSFLLHRCQNVSVYIQGLKTLIYRKGFTLVISVFIVCKDNKIYSVCLYEWKTFLQKEKLLILTRAISPLATMFFKSCLASKCFCTRERIYLSVFIVCKVKKLNRCMWWWMMKYWFDRFENIVFENLIIDQNFFFHRSMTFVIIFTL